MQLNYKNFQISGVALNTIRACAKFKYKGYEISIAMDDSCGALPNLSRSDIRVYRDYDGKDVTEQFCKWQVRGDADSLKYLFSQIDMYGDRD